MDPAHKPFVLVTREDPDPLVEALVAAGAEPVVLPLLATRWLAFELPHEPESYDWIVMTSTRTLDALTQAAPEHGWRWPPSTRAAAVGNTTAGALEARGWTVGCVSGTGTAHGLIEALGTGVEPETRILLPGSALADPELPEALRGLGALVDVVPVYTTEACWVGSPDRLPALQRKLVDAIDHGCVATCTSPSAVRALADLATGARILEAVQDTSIVVMGPTTARTAESLGMRVIQAENPSLVSLAHAAVLIGQRS